MKLKVIAFHMLCGSTEMFAQRGTSWSSRKLPSSVGSYDGSAICQQPKRHPTAADTPLTVDLLLICEIMSVSALMFCAPGMANAETRALYIG